MLLKNIKKLIESHGGKVVGSVSDSITAVVCNNLESQSSKAKKAVDLGIPFWSENDLFDRIDGN